MKKILGLCLVLTIMISAFSVTAFADTAPEGYVTFTRNGNVYVDMTETLSLTTDNYTVAESITVGSNETIDITLKQNAMFYNNSSTFSFLGYKIKTTNNNSDANVLITLTEGSTVFHTATVLKTTFASVASSKYVTGDTTINITLTPTAISATVTGSKGTVTLFENIALPSTRINTGAVVFKAGCTSATYRKLKTVNISSGSSEVTKSSFFMNKIFSSADNKDDLTADGYSLSNITAYSDSVGLARTTAGAMTVLYKGVTFSGAYTVELEAAKAHNNGNVYFNHVDANNYYRVVTSSDDANTGTLWIQKKVGGTFTSLLTDDDGATIANKTIDMGTNGSMKYVINLLPDAETGDLQITVTLRNGANVSRTFTVTDKKTDTYSPMTSGGVGYGNSYVNAGYSNYVKSIKVYPGDAAPAISGVFKNDGVETDEYKMGATTFGFPVALIGESPELIAALYFDNDMVDIKKLDITQVNSGDVPLFNTYGDKVKVFVWNSVEDMIPVDFPYTLPSEKSLKLMLFNTIHCTNQLTGSLDYAAFADAISSCSPDIVGLNEVRDEGSGLECDAQTQILSNLTGLKHYYFAQGNVQNGGPFGNGFLSKYPIESVETIAIPDPETQTGSMVYKSRCILKAKLKNGLTVMVTHFGLNADEQENAVATLLENLPSEKCIVMGDLQVGPDNEIIKPLLERLTDATPDDYYTYPADAPDRKIDYILVTPDIEVVSAQIPEIYVSDHKPLTAVVNIGE